MLNHRTTDVMKRITMTDTPKPAPAQQPAPGTPPVGQRPSPQPADVPRPGVPIGDEDPIDRE